MYNPQGSHLILPDRRKHSWRRWIGQEELNQERHKSAIEIKMLIFGQLNFDKKNSKKNFINDLSNALDNIFLFIEDKTCSCFFFCTVKDLFCNGLNTYKMIFENLPFISWGNNLHTSMRGITGWKERSLKTNVWFLLTMCCCVIGKRKTYK